MAAIAAGGAYSFEPEPDEDEAVLPGEDARDELRSAEALLAGEPVEAAEEVEDEQPAPAGREPARRHVPTEAVDEADGVPSRPSA